MPYVIRKVKGGYSVVNPATGAVHSKRTTKDKAEKQRRLLYMVHNKMSANQVRFI
jgi:hypothetical protein